MKNTNEKLDTKEDPHASYNSYMAAHKELNEGESKMREDHLNNAIAVHNSEHPDMQPVVNDKEGEDYDYFNTSEAAQ